MGKAKNTHSVRDFKRYLLERLSSRGGEPVTVRHDGLESLEFFGTDGRVVLSLNVKADHDILYDGEWSSHLFDVGNEWGSPKSFGKNIEALASEEKGR